MKNTVKISIIIIALLLLIIGINKYRKIARAVVPDDIEELYVYIPTNSSFDEVVEILVDQKIIKYEKTFRWLSQKMKYNKPGMRAGRFRINPGWSAVELIRHLRGGKQAPVNLVLTNERLIEDVAVKAARFIEPDSADLLAFMLDENFLEESGYTRENLICLFIPNTYEFFWNTSPKKFMARMIREHKLFWNRAGRKKKAKAIGLTPAEVYTLASIIEKETLQDSEKTRMAGIYINRLERGMLLQADPTCVFATGDFNTSRVTDYHLKFDSPYNTYLYKGLPPGPISMASIASVDAVLNAEDHDYIFFCARGDGSGLHAFAKTLKAHNQNAARYRRNLKKRGLR